jgi:hypothetical protein
MRFRYFAVVAIVAVASALGVSAAVAGGDKGKSKSKSNSNAPLFAALNGKNEISAQTGKKGAGDPDGRGGATVLIDGTQVCFGITVRDIAQPNAAHIHRGKRNENGPIVVTLTPPSNGDPGASSGCTTATADLAAEIQRHPRRFYVNVHTGDFPAGAVRGQLKRKPHQ